MHSTDHSVAKESQKAYAHLNNNQYVRILPMILYSTISKALLRYADILSQYGNIWLTFKLYLTLALCGSPVSPFTSQKSDTKTGKSSQQHQHSIQQQSERNFRVIVRLVRVASGPRQVGKKFCFVEALRLAQTE